MKEFDDIVKNWQNTEIKTSKAPILSKNILAKIELTEKSVYRRNIFKTFSLVLIFSTFFYYLFKNDAFSYLIIVGSLMILLSTIVFLFIYWRNQFTKDKLNYHLPEKEFVTDTLDQINEQFRFFRKSFFYFLVFLSIGINIMYFELFQSEVLIKRIVIHSIYTLFLFTLYFVGLRIREKVFNSKFKPLLQSLESIKNQFNNKPKI